MLPTNKLKNGGSASVVASQRGVLVLAGCIFLIGLLVYLSGGAAPTEANNRSSIASSSSSSSTRKDIIPNYSYQIRPGGNSAVKVKISGGMQPAVAPENSSDVANDDDNYDDEDFAELLINQDDYYDDDATAAEDNNDSPEEELLATPVAITDREQNLEAPSSPLIQTSTSTDSAASTKTTTASALTDAQQVHVEVSSDSSISALVQALDKARDAFFEKLKVDYGVEQYKNMFFTTTADGQRVTRGRTFMTSPSGAHGISFERLRRKLAKKILQAQISGKTVPLVWSNGGHSAAAGHGNLYNESSTAVLERNGQDIFNAVGLRLEGRNYAMGGTSSGMEIASCSKEIFGKDIDICEYFCFGSWCPLDTLF
jgi:hypothetical protein